MRKTLLLAALGVALAAVPSAPQTPQSTQPATLSPTLPAEIFISTLSPDDLKKQIAAEGGKIEDTSEVERGGPVAAVVRYTGCMKDEAGACNITANVTVYKPDGSIFHEVKAVNLAPTGRVAVPLNIDANAGTGLYKVVVTVRDLTARRFGVLERQFAVK